MIERREIGLCILLSIVTCGIYGLIWFYLVLKDLYYINNQPNNAGVDILLTIVTCGIYGIYMNYQMGKLDCYARQFLGLGYKDDSSLYLVLSLLGILGVPFLVLINLSMVQSDLNDNIIPAFTNMQVQYVMQNPHM